LNKPAERLKLIEIISAYKMKVTQQYRLCQPIKGVGLNSVIKMLLNDNKYRVVTKIPKLSTNLKC